MRRLLNRRVLVGLLRDAAMRRVFLLLTMSLSLAFAGWVCILCSLVHSEGLWWIAALTAITQISYAWLIQKWTADKNSEDRWEIFRSLLFTAASILVLVGIWRSPGVWRLVGIAGLTAMIVGALLYRAAKPTVDAIEEMKERHRHRGVRGRHS